jgi:hypothetical protein
MNSDTFREAEEELLAAGRTGKTTEPDSEFKALNYNALTDIEQREFDKWLTGRGGKSAVDRSVLHRALARQHREGATHE